MNVTNNDSSSQLFAIKHNDAELWWDGKKWVDDKSKAKQYHSIQETLDDLEGPVGVTKVVEL